MKYKYIPCLYSVGDHDAICRMLEKQAAKGWLPKNTEGIVWIFERCGKENLRFQILYADDQKETVPEKYLDSCKEAGWDYVCPCGIMKIFKTSDPNAPDLNTDEAVSFYAIKNGLKSIYLKPLMAFALISLLLIRNMLVSCKYVFFSSISRNSFILSSALVLMLPVFILLFALSLVLWVKRSERRLNNGFSCAPFPTKINTAVCVFMLVLCLLSLVSIMDSPVKKLAAFLIFIFGFQLSSALAMPLSRLVSKAGQKRALKVSKALAALIPAILYLALLFLPSAASENSFETYTAPDGRVFEIYSDPSPLSLADLGTALDEDAVISSRYIGQRSVLAVYERYVLSAITDEGYTQVTAGILTLPCPFFAKLCFDKSAGDYSMEAYSNIAVSPSSNSDGTVNTFLYRRGSYVISFSGAAIDCQKALAAAESLILSK